jgi:hypothetical protein
MLKRKHRTVVAAVLVGAALFSPLLCGMPCLETGRGNSSAAAEVAPAADELAGEFAVSAVVGCILTHVVLDIDWSDWTGVLEDGAWVWAGVEALRFIGEMLWI